MINVAVFSGFAAWRHNQRERNKIINAVKKQEIPILVATDLASKKQYILCVFVSTRIVSAPSG